MKFNKSFLTAAVLFATKALAQVATEYTDADTGITFQRFYSEGYGFSFGITFPENPTATSEFIGQIVGQNNGGWSGVSLGGGMVNNLLVVTWLNGDKIVHSLRMASGYIEPEVYKNTGPVLTPLHQKVNSTHFALTFRCQGCTKWGETGGFDPTSGFAVMGWASSLDAPANKADPASSILYHNNGFGQYGVIISDGSYAAYPQWLAKYPGTPTTTDVPGSTTAVPTSTEVPTTTSVPTVVPTGTPVPAGKEYDYIVVGGGAGGLVAADRLSESGKSVLLIERGPPSTYIHGGRSGPSWLEGKGLTRFDVPGLCNQIWVDSAGISCNDIDQMAGCILGGGTAVNAGLFFKPPARDFDYNFPSGWKATDMAPYVSKVFARIPSTDTPSMDGKRYLQEGHNVLVAGLKASGWAEVTANSVPEKKNRTISHTPFMFSNGERGGPLATYLVSAKKRANFQIVTDTMVERVVRTGGLATGVDVKPTSNNGYAGTFKLKKNTGRVVLSAGVFGTAKILFRSAIGPEDSLTVVANSATDGKKFLPTKDWIKLPVGFNAMDHINTDVVVSHPKVIPYDFYKAWNYSYPADSQLYIDKRAGVLATAAPGPNTMIWDQVTGTDGIVRHLQWTGRVEGSLGEEGPNLLTLSQYLGTGFTTRGRITIASNLGMVTSVSPYDMTAADLDATVQGVANLQKGLSTIKDLTWIYPKAGQSAADYVKQYVGGRRANHWMGTAKMGTDDGRQKDGKSGSVVDLDTKVYGTENIFVVDASIFPGHITTNPSAIIMSVAERAVAKILALALPKTSSLYQQCGGINWAGPKLCSEGECKVLNDYYYQCYPV